MVATRPTISDIHAKKDVASLTKNLRLVLTDLEAQLQGNPLVSTTLGGKESKKLRPGDLFVSFLDNLLQVGIIKNNGKKRFLQASDLQVLQTVLKGTNFLGFLEDVPLPSTTHFPNEMDWGFYSKTGGTPRFYLVFNHATVIKKIELTV